VARCSHERGPWLPTSVERGRGVRWSGEQEIDARAWGADEWARVHCNGRRWRI
jgi:hypothetical protein